MSSKFFQVGSAHVRVRSEPSLQGTMVKWLEPGRFVQVDADSRIEADGYVWWKHANGWSAECPVDGSEAFLVERETDTAEAEPRPDQVAEVAAEPTTEPEPTAEPEPKPKPRKLKAKEPGTPTPSGAVEIRDGFPNPETLPFRNNLFQKLPVEFDRVEFWQYYGNNNFAYDLWKKGKKWYSYSQGLHAGLDLGNMNTKGVQVCAGLEGTFIKRDTRYTRPNGMWVKSGDYTVIYGHLTNPGSFQEGQPIGVDTILGEIEFGGQVHLHLEIRYRGWIINPLLLMPEEMRQQVFAKFPPSDRYFHKSGQWNKWQTPMDQPIIVLGGGWIGPQA